MTEPEIIQLRKDWHETIEGKCAHEWEKVGYEQDVEFYKCKKDGCNGSTWAKWNEKPESGIPAYDRDPAVILGAIKKYKIAIMPDCEIMETVPDDNGLRQELVEWWHAEAPNPKPPTSLDLVQSISNGKSLNITVQAATLEHAVMRAVLKIEERG